MSELREISITVNGRAVRAVVEPRLLLSDFLRGEAGLTGTHVGCEHGICGACTVLFDGEAARSCLLFAVQADGCEVHTIEGLADCGTIAELQDAFAKHHALQCGFCTPGMLVIAHDFLNANPLPSEQDVREGMSAALCRCTGYLGIIKAVSEVAAARAKSAAGRAREDR